MKTTNLALLVIYVYLIIFFVLGIKLYLNVEEMNVINSFKDKIELSLDAATIINYDDLSDEDKEKVADGNFNEITIDKDKILNEFLRVLSLNSLLEEKKSADLSKYIDKLMLVDENGLIINYENQSGQRQWSDIIPYASNEGNMKYFLSDNCEEKEEAVMNTIRRNLVIENTNSNLICLPFIDEYGNYKPVTTRSVIVTFKDCPIRRNKKENIIMFSGIEYKNLNKKDVHLYEHLFYYQFSLSVIWKGYCSFSSSSAISISSSSSSSEILSETSTKACRFKSSTSSSSLSSTSPSSLSWMYDLRRVG